jgi:hypothetical protein
MPSVVLLFFFVGPFHHQPQLAQARRTCWPTTAVLANQESI